MPRVLLALAVLSATIFCIIECVQTDERDVRNLPKIVWLLLILIAPIAGPIAWFVAGRPRRDRRSVGPARPSTPARPVAPDDDPTFLARLDRTNQERIRLQAWERELEQRERKLGPSGGPVGDGSAAGGSPGDAGDQDGPGVSG